MKQMVLFCGSTSLLERIKDLKKLKYHIFGHIHESGGVECIGTETETRYTAVNASMFDYIEIKKPILIEI